MMDCGFNQAIVTKVSMSWIRLFPFLLLLLEVIAWGKDGHDMVANIAYRRLTNETQTVVKNILLRDDGSYGDDDNAGSPLASVANWADKVRFTKAYHWSTPLHYIDVQDKEIDGGCPCTKGTSAKMGETSTCRFVYERDCVDGICAAGAIANYTNQLGLHRTDFLRGSASESPLRLSLMFVTHFVGDIHQPLHSARASDKGGNSFDVKFDHAPKPLLQNRDGTRHSGWNLHSVWDAGITERAISEIYGTRENFEATLFGFIHQAEESGETQKWLECADGRNITCTSQWAEESLEDALRWAYRNYDGTEVVDGSELTDSYYITRLPVVTRRLAMAGVRLAASLETALATSLSGRVAKK